MLKLLASPHSSLLVSLFLMAQRQYFFLSKKIVDLVRVYRYAVAYVAVFLRNVMQRNIGIANVSSYSYSTQAVFHLGTLLSSKFLDL